MVEQKIIVFNNKTIRHVFYNNEWWFAVVDVITLLTDTVNASDYIKKMRLRDKELAQGWGQIVTPLRLTMYRDMT